MHETNDTICAMATAPGESGIGIIRISGPRALAVADAVFAPSSKGRCSAIKSFTVRHGRVVSREGRESEVLDEALCTVMRAPKSYTREDVVEISCHGGIVSMRRVLELVLENGCRHAEPGEFTRRAFLNGRIDLAQAEAVLDVIRAKTDAALRLGMGQLQGELSRRLERIRETLLGCLARLEAAIDFPEDDPRQRGTELAGLEDALSEAARLLEGSGRGRVYREGLQAVICGKPNAGKSSLLNALLREERSIVTPVAGTTRDTVEEIIDIRGIPVRIVDTAGLLEPRDLVEKKAVARTRSRISGADLVIAVFDGSRPLDAQDALLMRALPARRRVIAVVNKCDLKPRLDTRRIRSRYGEPVELSAKKARNISGLEEAISVRAGCAPQAGAALLGNIRHIQAVKKIKKIIEETLEYRDNKLPTECAAQNLKDCCSLLDGLLGKSFSGDMLDRIFGEFCIGK